MPELTAPRLLLRQAELEAEKLSAVVRLVIFASLATAIYAAAGFEGPSAPAGMLVALYGVGTVVGLLLAWRHVFHPAIPYLFVTFDVALVAAQVQMLTRMMGMQSAPAFAVPAAALIFIILIHASMRFRPWLVVYAAALFAILVEAAPLILPSTTVHRMHEAQPMMQAGMGDLLNFQVLPLLLIALAAFTLFITVRRTRRLLQESLRHAARTARLSRFFSPNLAARLADDEVEGALAGQRLKVAVIFVDIRGFTALGETMSPDELGRFLSEYRRRLTEPVFRHGGTVDKFIGDAIMAVFGSPLRREDDAGRAVKCALEILAGAERWSLERQARGEPAVTVGIGAHYGEVFAGAVGDEQLLEYTVIGDTVNVAERLERLSRDLGSGLIVSRDLLNAAGEGAGVAKWKVLPPQVLKGHREAVEAASLA